MRLGRMEILARIGFNYPHLAAIDFFFSHDLEIVGIYHVLNESAVLFFFFRQLLPAFTLIVGAFVLIFGNELVQLFLFFLFIAGAQGLVILLKEAGIILPIEHGYIVGPGVLLLELAAFFKFLD